MDDKISVKPGDVAQQKQAMKKSAKAEPTAAPPPGPAASKPARKKPGRKPGRKVAAPVVPAGQPVAVSAPRSATASPVDLIDSVFGLAQQCGGIEQLKRLVDRLAQVQER